MAEKARNTIRWKANFVAPSIVLLSGGMNVAWGLGFSSWLMSDDNLTYWWFIAAMVGAIFAGLVHHRLTTKLFLISASALVLLGGIIYTACPKYFFGLAAARFVNGFAFGWAFVPIIIVDGDHAAKSMRGRIVANEALMVAGGIAIQATFMSDTWRPDFTNASLIHGISMIVLGLVAMASAWLFTIESPIALLQRNDETAALECLARLHSSGLVDHETRAQLEEHKRLVAEDNAETIEEALSESIAPLAKLLLHRSLVALSFSLPLNRALISAAGMLPQSHWPLTVYVWMRWLGVAAFCLIADSVGRKKPLVVGLVGGGCALVAVGVFYNITFVLKPFDILFTGIFLFLLMVYQFFAGLYVAPSAPYLSEAFPLKVKPLCVAICLMAEMLVNTLVTFCYQDRYQEVTFFLFVGFLTLGFAGFVIIFMPETKVTTLGEARDKFRQALNMDFD